MPVIKPKKLIMNIFLLTFGIVSCAIEFYDDEEIEFTTHLLTTTAATTLTTPSSTTSFASSTPTPVLSSTPPAYEGSGNSTSGSGDGDEDEAKDSESDAPEVDIDQNETKNNVDSDYEDMNIKILNEPFKDEDLLRKALEMSLQE